MADEAARQNGGTARSDTGRGGRVRGDRGRRRRWIAAALLLAIVLAALGLARMGRVKGMTVSQAIPTEVGLSATPVASPTRVDYARLDARLHLLMQTPDMVGLAIGTVENGRVRFVRGYGEVLSGSGEAVTPDTVFRWGSVSKGVASSLVVQLAAQGKLSLDAPVASLGTSLRLPGDAAGVTVADILSHRTGLVRNAWDDRLEAGEDPRSIREAYAGLTPLCKPGTCHAYQNIAYDTATEIVERATGDPYATAAHNRLFAPLGMASASMNRAGLESAVSWARPHRLGRRPTQVNDIYYRVPAAGGVNASIADLTRWMRAQMGAAPGVLSPAMLETLHAPRVVTLPRGPRAPMDRALADAHYGLGWRSFIYRGHRLVGHRGTVDGYGSLILFDPAQRSGIVMLWNCNWHRAARMQLEFFDQLYGLPPTDWLALDELKR